jgi:hypothetical protein
MCLPIATVAYAERAHKIITTKIAAQVNTVIKTTLSFLFSIPRQLPFYAISKNADYLTQDEQK